MNRSPKLKPTLWDALVVLAVLALAGLLAARPFLAAKTAGELTVSISVDGETVERCALSTYEGGTYKSRAIRLPWRRQTARYTSPQATARIRTACIPARSRARGRALSAFPPAWRSHWRVRRPTMT